MTKYRGKYKKCRECKHSEEVLMMLVEVKESCPNHIKFSSMLAVDKQKCEGCTYFEREDKPWWRIYWQQGLRSWWKR